MTTALDIIKAALYEGNILAPGEALPAEDAKFGLDKLNDILDEWAARKIMCYNVNFTSYTLTPNHTPHTIGPTGDFAAAIRPVTIESASIVSNGVSISQLAMRDDDWWTSQRTKSITSAVPIDLYYSPDLPNGSLYLWPIPTVAYQLELKTWVALNQVENLADELVLPPAYRKALKLTLAEEIYEAMTGKSPGAMLIDKARKARSVIQGPNSASPRLNLRDGGPPNGEKVSSGNYLTGWLR